MARILQDHDSVRQLPTPQSAAKKDRVTLSSQGRELQALQQRLAQVPEVRADKVKALKAAIERGEYHVPARAIADKMLANDQPDGKRLGR